MIIECNNCNKEFQVSSKLIPNEGRLLQCSSCNHKWHFKKKIKIKATVAPISKSKPLADSSLKNHLNGVVI